MRHFFLDSSFVAVALSFALAFLSVCSGFCVFCCFFTLLHMDLTSHAETFLWSHFIGWQWQIELNKKTGANVWYRLHELNKCF